jgi:hypothetical protein
MSVSEPAATIVAANDALRCDFPLKPFAIRHRLAGDHTCAIAHRETPTFNRNS